MNKKYASYAIAFLVFYAPLAYSMRRIPAVHDSIAKLAHTSVFNCNYTVRSTPLPEIIDYFDYLFAELHEIFKIDMEFIEQMRRIKASLKRAPTVRAGYVSAIKYLELLKDDVRSTQRTC